MVKFELFDKNNFSIEIKDTQCGFKFLSTNKLNEIINEIETGGLYDLI